MGAAGYLYKPDTGKGPVLIVPNDGPAPTITLANGKTISAVKGNTRGGVYQGHEGYQWVFPNDILGQAGTFNINGETIEVTSTNSAYQGASVSGMKPRQKGSLGSGSVTSTGGTPGTTFGGGYDSAGNPVPTFVDSSGLQAGVQNVAPIVLPPYQHVDPRAFAENYAPFNRDQLTQNMQMAQQQALDLAGLETEVQSRFAPQASVLQQSLAANENVFNQGQTAGANTFNSGQVSTSNTFNRGELNTAIDASGLPIRDVVNEQLTTGRNLAKGFLPTTIEDRAFEMTARAKAADAFSASGLGTSSFTQNAIDKYTMGERLNLMQSGNAMVDQWLSKGAALLLDAPIKYNPLLNQPNGAKVSQDIRGLPGANAQSVAQNNASAINAGTLLPTSAAFSSEVQQNQFKSTQDFNVAVQNQNTEASQQKFNIGNALNVDLTKLQSIVANANLANQYGASAANRAQKQRLANQAVQQQAIGGTSVTSSVY
jgi:hypothetical protein